MSQEKTKSTEFRVCITLDGINHNLYDVEGLFQVPRADDLIDVLSYIDEDELDDGEYEHIFSLSWHVEFVSWQRDQRGFYANVWCNGE